MFFVTLLFLLAFSDVNRPRCFPSAAVFPSLGRQRGGKERTCDKTRRKDETTHAFCLQSSLDPNPHLCLSPFANCNCLPVIMREVSLYSPAGKVLGAQLQGDLTKTPPSAYVTLSGQVMLENGQIGHVTLQRSSHHHNNTNSSLPAPTGPMSQSSSRGVGFQNTGSPPRPPRSRSRVQDAGRRALGVLLIGARPSAPRNRAPAR